MSLRSIDILGENNGEGTFGDESQANSVCLCML